MLTLCEHGPGDNSKVAGSHPRWIRCNTPVMITRSLLVTIRSRRTGNMMVMVDTRSRWGWEFDGVFCYLRVINQWTIQEASIARDPYTLEIIFRQLFRVSDDARSHLIISATSLHASSFSRGISLRSRIIHAIDRP